MPVARIPLVVPFSQRQQTGLTANYGKGALNALLSNYDQIMCNVMVGAVANNYSGAATPFVYRRPGFSPMNAVSAADSYILFWDANNTTAQAVSATASNNFRVLYGSTPPTSVGTVAARAMGLSQTNLGTTSYIVIPATNNNIYYVDQPTKTLSSVTPTISASTNLTGACVHLDGFTFIMATDGKIWNSALNSLSSWGATAYISSDTELDNGVTLFKYRNNIGAFGTRTLEWFENAGNPTGSPLRRIDQATVKYGALNRNAVAVSGDVVAFAGRDETGNVGVFMLEGFQPKRISTPQIEAFLVVGDASADYLVPQLGFLDLHGHKLLMLNLFHSTVSNGARIVMVYDFHSKLWYNWAWEQGITKSTGVVSSTGPVRFVATWNGENPTTPIIEGTSSYSTYTSPVYTQTTFTQDATTTFEAGVQLGTMDYGTRRIKRFIKASLVGDIQASGTVTLQSSDDDFATWVTRGTFDLTKNAPAITRLGTGRNRAWRLTHATAAPWRAEALEVEYEILEN